MMEKWKSLPARLIDQKLGALLNLAPWKETHFSGAVKLGHASVPGERGCLTRVVNPASYLILG